MIYILIDFGTRVFGRVHLKMTQLEIAFGALVAFIWTFTYKIHTLTVITKYSH
jgi:hypothetical protein